MVILLPYLHRIDYYRINVFVIVNFIVLPHMKQITGFLHPSLTDAIAPELTVSSIELLI